MTSDIQRAYDCPAIMEASKTQNPVMKRAVDMECISSASKNTTLLYVYSSWLAPNKLMDQLDKIKSSVPHKVIAMAAKDNVKSIYNFINNAI